MQGFFIEYRDPLFGIIIFLSIIAAISFASFVWGKFDSDKKDRRIRRFIKRFEYAGFDEELALFLKTNDKPIKQMEYLASIYQKNGEHQKAIKIYLTILENIENCAQKIEILDLLGKCYLEAGFLQRSRDIFLESLRLYPRNKGALQHLLLIYESLNEYQKALEVLEPLCELGEEVACAQNYLKALSITNEAMTPIQQKSDELKKLLKVEPRLAPIVFDFFVRYDVGSLWSEIKNVEPAKIADILWSVPCKSIDDGVVGRSEFLKELYSAKGCVNLAQNSSLFELDAILALKKSGRFGATLSFEYVCSNCKHIFPLYAARCPNCRELLSLDVVPVLESKKSEERNSLQ